MKHCMLTGESEHLFNPCARRGRLTLPSIRTVRPGRNNLVSSASKS